MRLLIIGAGVIGGTYAWQLAGAGHDVTVFVREARKLDYERDGLTIRCRDARQKGQEPVETVFRPAFVSDLSPADTYDLIIVCVKSNQLDGILPLLEEKSGGANVLFFQNNWWGDQVIGQFLPPGQFLFGFSRLVGGWRAKGCIEAIIFDGSGQATMLGERDGRMTPRLQSVRDMMQGANLKPEISADILGWLMAHYVEYLGAVGAILKAGSAASFAADSDLVREAILATREGLDVCRARGLNVNKSAPFNLRMFMLPSFLTVPLGKIQYGQPDIQQFFEENVTYGMDEIAAQYFDVIREGRRLGIPMPHLEEFEPFIRGTARRTVIFPPSKS